LVHWKEIHLDPLKEIRLDQNLVHHLVYWKDLMMAHHSVQLMAPYLVIQMEIHLDLNLVQCLGTCFL